MELKKVTVAIENILLDPNNPRFADISDESLNIPFERSSEEEIQKSAFNKMMNPKFEVISLANSIETVGFLPVDYIVTRKMNENKYVVAEGNRRLTAIKFILKQYQLGQSLISPDKIEKLKNIDVLVVNNNADTDEVIKIIQGIRNVSGIKEWDPYQKAQFINDMVEKGKEPNTIAKMIGMSIKEVNRYFKTYSSLIQFKIDVEYGSFWKPSYFSYFDEIIKKPVLRKFLDWDENKFIFRNVENTRRFYEWIIPNEFGEKTFTDVRDIRKHLVQFIGDETALDYLDERNLQGAINHIERTRYNEPKISFQDCMKEISKGITAFKNIIGEGLEREMTDEEINDLEGSVNEMNNQIKRIRKLRVDE